MLQDFDEFDFPKFSLLSPQYAHLQKSKSLMQKVVNAGLRPGEVLLPQHTKPVLVFVLIFC